MSEVDAVVIGAGPAGEVCAGRLAEDLERSRDQLVRAAHVAVVDGTVRLELQSDGDDRVPRWAAGREVELFARAFDRRLTV